MKTTHWLFILLMMIMTVSCGASSTPEALGDIIHISIDTQNIKGARVYFRIESQTEEVNSTIRFQMGTTPYRETRSLSIPGLTKANMADVNIVIEVRKKGFYSVVERFNMTSVMADKRIGKVFPLYKRAHVSYKAPVKKKTAGKKTKKKRKKTQTKKKITENETKKTPAKKKTTEKTLAEKSSISSMYKINYPKPKSTARPQEKIVPKAKPITVAAVVTKDIYEPNNTPNKAKAIYVNREYSAKIDSASDLDHYMIFLGEKPKYKLVIDQIPDGAKYKLEIITYPKDSQTVFQINTSGNKEELAFNLKDKDKKTGVYCVKISHLSGKTGKYRLKIMLDR